jgi:predicted nuclease of predicted toxin-antitoxin system
MRFLANENFPYPSIRLIRERGYEVISIGETQGGIADPQVLAFAVAEGLTILTFDRDYGELLFRYRITPPPAVVYFRNKGASPTDAAHLLFALLENPTIQLLGHFTVIDEQNVRQRPL